MTAVAVDLSTLLAPPHAALVANECQRGVIGDHSLLPELAKAAVPVVPVIAHLAAAARRAGVPVVHTTAVRRADGRGSNQNARLFMATRRSPTPMVPGTPQAEIVAEIGVAESDLVLPRMHGLSPMSGTELDPVLRNL
ncbi:MAG TPA: isochorismatase family protein, partial [Verrucomicrobiae bacterium]|nr:isochorismatase family protein [Verrucomicrobiae bacterium]